MKHFYLLHHAGDKTPTVETECDACLDIALTLAHYDDLQAEAAALAKRFSKWVDVWDEEDDVYQDFVAVLKHLRREPE